MQSHEMLLIALKYVRKGIRDLSREAFWGLSLQDAGIWLHAGSKPRVATAAARPRLSRIL